MEKIEELRKMDKKRLSEDVKILKNELTKIEFELKTGQKKDNHQRKLHRRQIARMETIINSSK